MDTFQNIRQGNGLSEIIGPFPCLMSGASDFLMIVELLQYLLNAVYRIQKTADRGIVIQGVDDQSYVFAHVAADIVLSLIHICAGRRAVFLYG